MADHKYGDLHARAASIGWDFIVLMSRQGKIRLAEFFTSYTESDKRRILRDIAADILPRAPKMCNIIEKGEHKYVYRRYASLYFVAGVPSSGTNELIALEQIHLFVEVSWMDWRGRGRRRDWPWLVPRPSAVCGGRDRRWGPARVRAFAWHWCAEGAADRRVSPGPGPGIDIPSHPIPSHPIPSHPIPIQSQSQSQSHPTHPNLTQFPTPNTQYPTPTPNTPHPHPTPTSHPRPSTGTSTRCASSIWCSACTSPS